MHLLHTTSSREGKTGGECIYRDQKQNLASYTPPLPQYPKRWTRKGPFYDVLLYYPLLITATQSGFLLKWKLSFVQASLATVNQQSPTHRATVKTSTLKH